MFHEPLSSNPSVPLLLTLGSFCTMFTDCSCSGIIEIPESSEFDRFDGCNVS